MHEMSIARSLFKLLHHAAIEKNAKSIVNFSINVGRFSGVEVELLERAFAVISEGTMASNSKIEISVIDFIIKCNLCGKETSKEEIDMRCPICENTDTSVVSGQDIFLTGLEITV